MPAPRYKIAAHEAFDDVPDADDGIDRAPGGVVQRPFSSTLALGYDAASQGLERLLDALDQVYNQTEALSRDLDPAEQEAVGDTVRRFINTLETSEKDIQRSARFIYNAVDRAQRVLGNLAHQLARHENFEKPLPRGGG